MNPLTKSYTLERTKDAGAGTYYVRKQFVNGIELLWARFLLRRQAIDFIRKESKKENVPMAIKSGVFRRPK